MMQTAASPSVPSATAIPASGGALVVPFSELGRGDLARVGGKGANLGEMTRAGFPVPPGFCVTTAAWDLFLIEATELGALLDAIDATPATDTSRLRDLATEVRTRLEALPIPDGVAAGVRAALAKQEPGHRFAVRSSATLEDLEGNSFAGQQDTYLNLEGEDAILDATRRCWASLFTDRAVTYRRQAGFDSHDVKLAVVVQRMVLPEVSGILFTADPVSGHRGVASIDASWGLGEALVSGRVNADLYRVRKRDGKILEARVGDKHLAIWPLEEGGTRTEEFDDERSRARVLDDDALHRLTELAGRVEAHYGSPQDIEWCLDGGELFLVQARPITSLFPRVDPVPDDGVHIYLSFNHIQVMLDPIAPLGFDSMRWVIPVGRDRFDQPSDALVTIGSRIYGDVSAALQTFPFSKIFPLAMSVIDPVMAALALAAKASDDFRTRGTRERVQRGRLFRMLALPAFRGALKALRRKNVANAPQRIAAAAGSALERCQRAIAAAPNAQMRLAEARRALAETFQCLLPVAFGPVLIGAFSWRILRIITEGRVAPATIDALTRGFEGNITTQMDLELGDLADVARTIPGLPERLRSFPPEGDLDGLKDLPGVEPFLSGLATFLDHYGHRTPGEIDLTRRRWREQPGALFAGIVGMLQDPRPGQHRLQEKRAVEQAETAAKEILDVMGRGLLGGLRRRVVARLIFNLRSLLALREHPKYYALTFFDEARKVFLGVGAELVAQDRIDDEEDVYFLKIEELEAAVGGDGGELKALVARRRAAFERDRALRPPRIITSEGEVPSLPPPKDLPPGGLLGVPASSGTVEGVARVILDPMREVLHAGEILVAPFTDPGWTPLFVHATGLVMEVGGLMTHGSVVAREYGIPAVVGLDHATTRIKTGDRIRVDGTTGLVLILGHHDDAEAAEAGESTPAADAARGAEGGAS